MLTRILGAWAITVGSLTVIASFGSCGEPSPPFYRCPGELRPKASFVETCVASQQHWLGDPLHVKMLCLSSAAQHGYCEAVSP